MAVYRVEQGGKAPSHAKAGDKIVTGGGTYEVLDSSQYQGKSASELSAMGVGFNPTSGLYSRKVGTSDSAYTGTSTTSGGVDANYSSVLNKLLGVSDVQYKSYDPYKQLTEASYQNQLASLERNYNDNLANLKQSYNSSLADYNTQINDVNRSYEKNRDDLYADTYYNNKVATQMASNRGLTSSAQGLAMNTTALAQASARASELTADRDTLINNIQTQINRLSEQYNINKDTLLANFNADKTSAMSTRDLQYMQACLEVDDYNANLWNTLVQNKADKDFSAQQAQLDRDFQASENAKDRALQQYLSSLSYSSGSGSSSTENDEVKAKVQKATDWMNIYAQRGQMTEQQYIDLKVYLSAYENGSISWDRFAKEYYKTLASNGVYTQNGAAYGYSKDAKDDNGSSKVETLVHGLSNISKDIYNNRVVRESNRMRL